MALLDKECLATTQYSTLSLNKKNRGSIENEEYDSAPSLYDKNRHAGLKPSYVHVVCGHVQQLYNHRNSPKSLYVFYGLITILLYSVIVSVMFKTG